MFKLNLGDTPHSLTDSDFDLLGEQSEGYSGSDIAVVVREALMEPLRKCQLARQFLRDPNGFLHPCVCQTPQPTTHNTMTKPTWIASEIYDKLNPAKQVNALHLDARLHLEEKALQINQRSLFVNQLIANLLRILQTNW
jgi:SpoVK/Ycf46/Vps4 family AAA+-type ATPase